MALVADADAAGKDGHNYPPQGRILQALADMPVRASIVVVSGRQDGGLHVYWLFREPFLIEGDEDRQRIKSLSERWQRLLKSKLTPYDLDSTFDLVRVLRPIGTTNHKYGSTVSALVFEPERRYRGQEFEEHLPAPPTPRPISYTPPSNGETWWPRSTIEAHVVRGHHPRRDRWTGWARRDVSRCVLSDSRLWPTGRRRFPDPGRVERGLPTAVERTGSGVTSSKAPISGPISGAICLSIGTTKHRQPWAPRRAPKSPALCCRKRYRE